MSTHEVGALGARQHVLKTNAVCWSSAACLRLFAEVLAAQLYQMLTRAQRGSPFLTFLPSETYVSACLCSESQSVSRSCLPRAHQVAPCCPRARRHCSQLSQDSPEVPLQPVSGAAVVCMGERELGLLGEPNWGSSVVL